MNYENMFDYYINKEVDVMIFVIEVFWEEVSCFGILNINSDLDVMEFDEKLQCFKNNLVFMGIYIFKWSILKEYLEMDVCNLYLSYDFGKDVILFLLDEKKKLIVYLF